MLRTHSRWALLTATGLLVIPVPASAHTGFVESQPSNGQTLRQTPRVVTVSFSEPPLPTGAALVALGPDGRIQLPADTRGRSVEAPWPPDAPNGAYTLTYRVVAADGHPITGEVSFRLDVPRPSAAGSGRPSAAPPTQQSSAPQATDAEPDASIPAWLWLIAVALIGAGAYLAIARGRKGE